VVPQLRRIEQAGAGSGRAVEVGGVEEAPRALTAAIGELDGPDVAEPPLGELGASDDREIRAA
jgi:hypothetical protein